MFVENQIAYDSLFTYCLSIRLDTLYISGVFKMKQWLAYFISLFDTSHFELVCYYLKWEKMILEIYLTHNTC